MLREVLVAESHNCLFVNTRLLVLSAAFDKSEHTASSETWGRIDRTYSNYLSEIRI